MSSKHSTNLFFHWSKHIWNVFFDECLNLYMCLLTRCDAVLFLLSTQIERYYKFRRPKSIEKLALVKMNGTALALPVSMKGAELAALVGIKIPVSDTLVSIKGATLAALVCIKCAAFAALVGMMYACLHWPVGCRIHRLLICRGVRLLPNVYPGYDFKQSDGEVPVTLEVWGMRSTPLLPSLPGPLWPGLVAPDRD